MMKLMLKLHKFLFLMMPNHCLNVTLISSLLKPYFSAISEKFYLSSAQSSNSWYL